ncbi:hypothetical protein CAPTEDRAFT_226300 [Capitella teleta]|uniref:Pre-mRNA processing factor 4 (PRP4)-like domain-containing protein n=1 Tax=Capitella teleta TaxID=283909 RepID=R7VDE1_CAPTE|nr:hypothetical protein CAPTEDRAFT_226300 [Capitella teleta]|eukprot:ELU16587.1 hypothetical protein CAPTEDRAFT_226300 [Capitella teleta]
MSDEEELHYVRKTSLHYGSIEEQEKTRIAKGKYGESLGHDAIKAGIRAGNINLAGGQSMYIDPDDSSQNKKDLLEEFERRKRVRQIHVSTDDGEVKIQLRQFGEPICLFGEGPQDRRERLRKLLGEMGNEIFKKKNLEESDKKKKKDEENVTWYHQGPDHLRAARLFLARYSLPRAQSRLEKEREEHKASTGTQKQAKLQELHKKMRTLSIESSQIGDSRPISFVDFDKSWRLWDLEAQEEVLHQEGHSEPVYDISFQCDGSLAVTGGLDSYGRVWDLRTGRCIMFMDGHLKSVLCVDFAPNGYQIATGSEDNSVKIWDLRMRSCEYTIPAHTNLVSSVQFQPGTGNFLLSSSYDTTGKIWAYPNWTPVKTLEGHEGKVMSACINHESSFIATASYDRTFKIWKSDDLEH